jgi:hypothetical protein
MSTSVHQGRLLTGRTWDANAAVDASFVRDVVQNNLCHFADEFAQVRVAYSATSSAFDDTALGMESASFLQNTFTRIVSFGPFPLNLRQNGDGYKLRVRVAGAATAALTTATYRVVVCPISQADGLYLTEDDFVFEATSSSTSAAWLSGTSQGSLASTTLITIPGSLASSWITTTSTLDDVSGNVVGVEQCLVCANVYAKSSEEDPDPDTRITLSGLYLAEFIG